MRYLPSVLPTIGIRRGYHGRMTHAPCIAADFSTPDRPRRADISRHGAGRAGEDLRLESNRKRRHDLPDRVDSPDVGELLSAESGARGRIQGLGPAGR